LFPESIQRAFDTVFYQLKKLHHFVKFNSTRIERLISNDHVSLYPSFTSKGLGIIPSSFENSDSWWQATLRRPPAFPPRASFSDADSTSSCRNANSSRMRKSRSASASVSHSEPSFSCPNPPPGPLRSSGRSQFETAQCPACFQVSKMYTAPWGGQKLRQFLPSVGTERSVRPVPVKLEIRRHWDSWK